MKIIKQYDKKDCGPACLAMIAYYHGLKIPIQTIREITFTNRKGTSIYDMVEGGKALGFLCNGLHGSVEELIAMSEQDICYPVILHLKTNHFVILEKHHQGIFTIIDPMTGRCKLNKNDFCQLWSGYLIDLRKGGNFQKKNLYKKRYEMFLKLIIKLWKQLLAILIFSVIITTISFLGTYLFQYILDDYEARMMPPQHVHEELVAEEQINPLVSITEFVFKKETIPTVFITVIIMYLFQGGIQYFRSYILARLAKNIDIELLLKYYAHLLRLPINTIKNRLTGEYLARFSDTVAIRNAVAGVTVAILIDAFMVLYGGFFLYQQNIRMFYFSFILVAMYIMIILLYKNRIAKINSIVMERNAEVQSFFKESIDGIETIKSYHAEGQVFAIFNKKFMSLVTHGFKGNLLFASQEVFIALLESLGTVLLIWYGINSVLAGNMSIGSLITFYLLFNLFVLPIKNIVELQPSIQKALVAIDRLNDIFILRCEENEANIAKIHSISKIEYKNVNFSYDRQNKILKDISMIITKGSKVAITGRSGSGKSTMAKLLLGFYQAKGSILINDILINAYSLPEIRKNIVYINQDTFLFASTILENILLGIEDDLAAELVDQVCELSGLADWIRELPLGLNTLLEENGLNLSSGQRQRIALARALVRQPEIIIFDEATCNLDEVTEKNILQSIESLTNVTCIMISHKKEVIGICDEIYILEDGKLFSSNMVAE